MDTDKEPRSGALDPLVICSVPGDGPCNEDRVGATAHAAWVIDGATGVGESLMPHASDAGWFAEAFDTALRYHLERTPEASTPDVLRDAIEAVRRWFDAERRAEPGAPYELPSAAFAMVRRIDDGLELSALGDCTIIHAAPDRAPSLFSASGVGRFEAETLAELAALYASDPTLEVAEAKRLLMPRLRRNRTQMNTEDGYWILSLDPRAVDHLERQWIGAGAGTVELALASDGFMRLHELFGLVTPGEMLAVRSAAEADAMLAKLRRAELEDDGCRTFVRAKRSDDASFVRARVHI